MIPEVLPNFCPIAPVGAQLRRTTPSTVRRGRRATTPSGPHKQSIASTYAGFVEDGDADLDERLLTIRERGLL